MPQPQPQPQNIKAEEALLGAILINPEALEQIDGLKPSNFYLLKHRQIFEAMLKLKAENSPIDFVTLSTALEQAGNLQSSGGAVYLTQLIAATPSGTNASAYAKLIMEASRKRELLALLSDVAKLTTAQGDDLPAASEYIKAQIDALLQPQPATQYQSFAELADALQPISWLWAGWIPRGMITLLGASPGAGKSMVALDIARRIISSDEFPDGSRSAITTKNIIYVDAEVVPQIIKERCTAWRMDLSKLFLMMPRPHDMIDFSRDEYRIQLRAMSSSLNPDLIIIDSLSSISSRGENNIEDIRGILAFLNELAAESNAGLLLIHHLRKRGGMQIAFQSDISIDDFRGSSHIIAMARSVLALSVIQTTQEVSPNGPRKLQCVKSNIGAYPKPLGVEFLPQPSGVYLKWDREAPKPFREPSKVELCAEWLKSELAEAPLALSELAARGIDAGYSRATIFRAREYLGKLIQDTDGRQSPSNKWKLVSLS